MVYRFTEKFPYIFIALLFLVTNDLNITHEMRICILTD